MIFYYAKFVVLSALIQLICVGIFCFMKSLFTVLGLFCSLTASAQKYEFGLSGGVSNTSRVKESLYSGDKGKWTYAAGINFHYNISPRLQAGLEAGMTHWERTGAWTLYANNNQSLGTKEVTFLFAERALSLAVRLNYVVPLYNLYEDFVRSSFYGGISLGGVATGNEGKIEYSKSNPNTPAEYRYVSRFQYESGYGTVLGLQVGYNYFFSKLLGMNIEFAPKMAWVKTVDAKYGYANDTYNILYFPATIGLRFRFGEIHY